MRKRIKLCTFLPMHAETDEERRFMRSDMAVWYAQLQMFPGVSTKKYVNISMLIVCSPFDFSTSQFERRAMNIIRKYPSFRSLMDAYSASESDKAKEQLLQVSRKHYCWMLIYSSTSIFTNILSNMVKSVCFKS